MAFLASMLMGCEKTLVAETDGGTPAEQQGNLKVSIFQLEQMPFSQFTRSEAGELVTCLNFAVYDMDGNRLNKVNQKKGDSDFGSAGFQLAEGNYQLVALAHSSNGNPTMTDPAKIQFTNSQGYTDTFLYYSKVTIGQEPQTLSLSLRRITSLCRFIINDEIPEGVEGMEFYYQGGSGHFNAATGFGVTKSKQDVSFGVEAGQRQAQFDLYTFLHDSQGTIHLKVTAYGENKSKLLEREFDVPMEQNKITRISGDFFSGATLASSQSITTTTTLDGVWGGEQVLTY